MSLKRREFITILGGAAAAWPLAARAQQPAMPVIGLLSGLPIESLPGELASFRQGLQVSGYVEGRNVAIEIRSAEGQYERLPALAADLASHKVNVIFAFAGPPSALAAKAATSTIPIVFVFGSDPVKLGLVASFNRPGGNVTGVSFLINALAPKRLELLTQLVPAASVIGLLANPTNPGADSDTRDVLDAGKALGRTIHVVSTRSERDFEPAFNSLAERQVGALVVMPDALFTSRKEQLVALVARHRLPTIYHRREFAVAGGLMTYGTNIADANLQAGRYTAQILRGEKPADLPIMQSTKFELVINLKAAKALGLTVSPSLLAVADEVIE
jgi:putative ABC transport system substrate-binding protein